MILKAILRTMALTTLVAAATGCNKEKDTKAIIHVNDPDGHPVAGAYVKLYANIAYPLGDASRLKREGLTESDGSVEFDYTQQYKQGQAGFAVLDILTYKDTLYAEGIIKILEEETNEETVTMKLIPQ